ncbi:MAG TPA: acyl-ACP desaturase [Tepidisphaeraceae bacterium]|jgi:acyl-[acyl-carrier-protein] desaturase
MKDSSDTLPPDPVQSEVLRGLSDDVAQNLMLSPIDEAWQPSDYLPDLTGDDWVEQMKRFREPATQLDDELLVVLVADMITEEALPSYSVALNLLADDPTGTSDTPWAKWMRGWTAEENRHGDLLSAYLRLTGRVDMRAVETTIHHLLNSGFNPQAYPDLYGGLVYTAFQERATKVSHANVGRMAAERGDENLNRICLKIAGDEARHESFYTRMMSRVMDQDPAGGIMTFRSMMRRIIVMPGRLMYDGRDPDLFDHFATVAQRTRTYTVRDYAAITEHLLKTWRVAERQVSGNAARAQEYLCRLPDTFEKTAERVEQTLANQPRHAFSWIYGRKA